ncbi:hypothetical protein MM239_07855 [Belliella sp. DSM 111904]|uniref:DUF4625 domain-containing protein n=1 Tax=Belliella filtrata TaxID=2923435 RepID=A0ABS9UYR5_9BACT|nr:hypothetical protein [Belliella filtrata]MCH7409302.1 hypothetical protein [Belliella filtrata]
MKKLIYIAFSLFASLMVSSCILEEVEPEYDIVGAVGTIANLTANTTTPTVGQTVTFTVTFYSEHENATSLRMNRLNGTTATNLSTIDFNSWNKEDSRVETFQYEIPEGTTPGALVIQFELITSSGFSTTRNITLTVQS